MDTITRQIAEYASSVAFEDLNTATVEAATQRLIDAIGCALGANDCEPAQIGRRIAQGQAAGRYPGHVICHGGEAPLEIASFINTAMIRNLDFNDRYPGGHPSDCLGALLAFAGATPVDGQRFIAAMTVAYEIFARLADAAKLSRRGWDQGFGIALATRPRSAICYGSHARRLRMRSESRRPRACRCGSRARASSRRGRTRRRLMR